MVTRWTSIIITVALLLDAVITSAFYYRGRLSSARRWMSSFQMTKEDSPKAPSRHNAPGNLFVDGTCINCDVCRWMCPSVYGQKGLQAVVIKQPEENHPEKLQAFAAMVACPVGAIRTHSPDPIAKDAIDVFPAEINPETIPNVYHCGYHAAESFGATSYFIKRPDGVEGGNVMIDCPRFNSRLADIIESEGGLHTMILTHRDDISDHRRWKQRFPALQRIMHMADVTNESDDVEVQLSGEGTWFPFRRVVPTDDDDGDEVSNSDNSAASIPKKDDKGDEDQEDEESFEGEDIAILHTPGHTAGSLCVLYDTYFDGQYHHHANDSDTSEASLITLDESDMRESAQLERLQRQRRGEVVLFSGDTVAFDGDTEQLDGFIAFNHGSLQAQQASIRDILAHEALSFHWILPAHGRMQRFDDDADRIAQLQAVAAAFDPQQRETLTARRARMRQRLRSGHPMG